MKKISYILLASLLLAACGNSSTVQVGTEAGTVRLQVITPEIVRVSVSPDGEFADRKSLMVLPQKGCTEYTLTRNAEGATLETSALKVAVHKSDGTVHFFRADGTPLALDGHAAFEPMEADGKKAWSTTVSYASSDDEAFYGLGQHQAGEFNHKGLREEL